MFCKVCGESKTERHCMQHEREHHFVRLDRARAALIKARVELALAHTNLVNAIRSTPQPSTVDETQTLTEAYASLSPFRAS